MDYSTDTTRYSVYDRLSHVYTDFSINPTLSLRLVCSTSKLEATWFARIIDCLSYKHTHTHTQTLNNHRLPKTILSWLRICFIITFLVPPPHTVIVVIGITKFRSFSILGLFLSIIQNVFPLRSHGERNFTGETKRTFIAFFATQTQYSVDHILLGHAKWLNGSQKWSFIIISCTMNLFQTIILMCDFGQYVKWMSGCSIMWTYVYHTAHN